MDYLALAITGFLKAAVVIAPVGEAARLQMTPRQMIKEGWVANDSVIDLSADGSAYSVFVKGKAPGFSPLVLNHTHKRSQFFLVVVPKPK